MNRDIALALGGGGAKGNSHIGVLRRLEREGYRIGAVAGTSFGGLVAVMYAYGFTPNEIEDRFAAVDQGKLYGRDEQDGPSLLGLSGVRNWLKGIFGEQTFADLKIPCAVTAVDVLSGSEITIQAGPLKEAILATIAVPGIFPPSKQNGLELVDGAVLNPVPVSVARMLAPDLPIVAVVLNDPLDQPVQAYRIPVPAMLPRSIVERISRMNFAQTFDIFMRAVDINSRAVAHYRLEVDAPDIVIRPAVHEIEILDKVNVHEVAQLGEFATEEVLPELAQASSWLNRLRRKVIGAGR